MSKNKKFIITVVSLGIILLLSDDTLSSELFITCQLTNNVNENNMSTSFAKKIDIETKKITSQTGIKFDKIIHYGENEIIFNNDIYENYSVYDPTSNSWSIFSERSISLYKCSSEKTPNEWRFFVNLGGCDFIL